MSGVIQPDSIVRAKETHLSANLDDEVVLLSVETGNYYGLDQIGTRVWELIDEPRSVRETCVVLCDEYAVEPADCERDVTRLLEQLLREGLIEVTGSNA